MHLSIACHYRAHLRHGNREGSVFLRVIYDRKVGNLTLPFRIFTEEWDEGSRSVIVPSGSHRRSGYLKRVAEGIVKVREQLLAIASELESQDMLDVVELLEAYRQGWHSNGLKGLMSYLCGVLTDEGRYRTCRAYRTSVKKLLCFLGREDCGAGEITGGMLSRYEQSLYREELSLHTVSFYMRNLRAVYNKGIRLGYFTGIYAPDPFRDVYTGIPKTGKRALESREVKKLENLREELQANLPDSSGDKTIRFHLLDSLCLFLFAFHAQGMSFVDLAHVKKSDLCGHILTYRRHKTGQRVRVVLTREAQALLRGLRNGDVSSPYLFSLIRDNGAAGYRQYCTALRKQNARLKQLAGLAGLAGSLSTHMARHSWATIAKQENVPIAVISESLGHSSLSTTYIYLDSFNASTIGRANRKVSGAIKKAMAV